MFTEKKAHNPELLTTPVMNKAVNNWILIFNELDIRFHEPTHQLRSLIMQSEWDTDLLCEDCLFDRHLWVDYIVSGIWLYLYRHDEMHMCSFVNVFNQKFIASKLEE